MRNPRYVDGMRQHELDRAFRLLRRGEDPARVLEELSRRLMNKLIHDPTKALRDATRGTVSPHQQRTELKKLCEGREPALAEATASDLP